MNSNIELLEKIINNNLYENSYNKQINNILMDVHTKAFYKNKLTLGKKIGCFLLENENDLDKNLIQCNQIFYLPKIKDIPGSKIYTLFDSIFDVDNPKECFKNNKYSVFNPSIFKDDNQLYVNIRHASFYGNSYTPMSQDEIIKTKNTFGKLEENKLIEYKEIIDNAIYNKVDHRVKGFEDMKIFKHNNKWSFVATSYETSRSTDVIYGILDDFPEGNTWKTHNVTPLRGSMVNENIPEKNWMPIIDGTSTLKFVYSTFPLHIVKFNTENNTVETHLQKNWNKNLGYLRGSSCLVPYDEGYVFVTHEVYFIKGERNYIHRILWISKDYNIMKYSDPFFFERNNKIEYCNGIAFHDSKFYITYGDGDKIPKLIIVDEKDIINLLENITE
jgi:hypothetical protein